jgi:integrase
VVNKSSTQDCNVAHLLRCRLQTLDGGAPVSLFTVSRELGHTSPAMVQHVYSHLGTVRHRSEVVEYRIEQHRKALGKRIQALAERA